MKKIHVGKKNNVYQHIEVIKNNRKKRSRDGEFFIEGAKSINNAVENNWSIRSLIYSETEKLSEWGQEILKYKNVEEHIILTPELMRDLSDKNEDYSEILALAYIPDDDLNRIQVKKDTTVIVIDRPSNHGNLGTILRSCEVFNVDGVIISGHAVDLYDVKTIRSSLGTLFNVPVVRVSSYKEVEKWIHEKKSKEPLLQVIGTTSQTELIIDDVDMVRPTILMIGNETRGLSHNYKTMCDVMTRIPMYGKITSYNVACATSMMLYEINRQRRKSEKI
jgi:TrmH family RNA methyltransferase